MDAVNPFSEDNPLVFDIKLEEDIEAELEEFVLLTRLGVYQEAKEFYHEVLKEHQHLFPVFAELAGFFVELGEIDQLSALLKDFESTGTTFDSADKRELFSFLSDFAEADFHSIVLNNTYLYKYVDYFLARFEDRDPKTRSLLPLSSAQIQSCEVLFTAATKTSYQAEYLSIYCRRQIENLLERGLFWEATQIFAAIVDNSVAEKPIQRLLLLSDILDTYKLIRLKLLEDDNTDTMLCNLRAKHVCLNAINYRLLYGNEIPKSAAHVKMIATLQEHGPSQMKELMDKLFRELPDPKPRGIYEDFLRSDGEYQRGSHLLSKKNTTSASGSVVSRKGDAEVFGAGLKSSGRSFEQNKGNLEFAQSRKVTDHKLLAKKDSDKFPDAQLRSESSTLQADTQAGMSTNHSQGVRPTSSDTAAHSRIQTPQQFMAARRQRDATRRAEQEVKQRQSQDIIPTRRKQQEEFFGLRDDPRLHQARPAYTEADNLARLHAGQSVTIGIMPQKKVIDPPSISVLTDRSKDISLSRTQLVQEQKASGGGHQTVVRAQPPPLDSRSFSVSHQPHSVNVGSERSSFRKWPSRVIDEPSLDHILPEPNDISYTLTVTYNNNNWRVLDDSSQSEPFPWTLSATYERLVAKIEKARKTIQLTAKLGHTVQLYYGALRIIGQDHEYSQEIKALTQLEEITVQSICGFVYSHPKQRFRLEYFIAYSSYRAQTNMGEKYLEMVREEVHRLMDRNKNFNDQKFIPRYDRDQFASKRIISGIIAEEANLDPIACEILSREIIRRGATGLFLACVTGYLPMDEFRRLFGGFRYNDGTLPQTFPNHTDRNDQDYRNLVKHIHAFFAKTIDESGRHMELEDHEVMPIFHVIADQAKGDAQLESSTLGHVRKVRIESSHHTLPTNNKSLFALKTRYDLDKQGFERDLAMLSRLRKQRHPHVAHHITSWSQKGIHYILYPWATDSLRSYMCYTAPPAVSWPSVRWFLRQVSGLVSAVHHIHEQLEQDETLEGNSPISPVGIDPQIYSEALENSTTTKKMARKQSKYHHDLKPENVLIFEQREGINPVFKISDFGAAKFTDLEEKKESHQTSNLGGTDSYFGPKWDQSRPRPFDIWALGCILTELLIWFLQDERLEDFHRGREQASTEILGFTHDYYWERVGSEKRLKRIVLQHLNDIKVNCRYDFERSLPAGVLKDLPSTILRCFAIDSSERPTAGKLHGDLQQMVDGAEIAGEEVEIEVDASISPGSRHSQDDEST